MSAERVHATTHEVNVAAPAGVVYGLISDAVQWPLFFPPNVHVERLEFDGASERLRMWATANGQVKSWTSRRVLDPARRRIEFRQELPASPVQSMGGTWIVEPLDANRSKLTLLHDFTVAGDAADDVAWVERATDTNSRAELDNLSRLAERWSQLDDLVLSFEDSVRVNGPAELVYDFLYRVADWPQLVPHVSRLELTEDQPGVQVMAMDTVTADGSTHTTESVRVCFPHAGRIVYKQTATPLLMAAHTGEWSVVPDETGVTVTSQHSVVLRPENIESVLGPDADVQTARRYVREALGRNSGATLALAKKHAESAVRVL
ncbi:aromatase/cyclase [Streptomyces pristinaespiralis]|jgi:aromatase|uniref:Cyclase n=2 Tax=Streptomyces pristinaespiralis TaxID=38300 RepID=B5HJY1_STRE2|nr:aromatase/cyclase [Streptomyces pristinaespiralis]ALC18505.1 Polyketide cyclase / dehydrase and lipid transport [Streptomyces pristinaespiralis]ALC25460.1 Polyketide cyclase / dehydrase and lipid transport [Streptomyces pristinaespiralis]EDY67142.1 cyclase [Streptomyces pristinaespiralis ATCC 25486]QMU12337.1 SRPBCC family protein [Streptomyces pristinaespiralis]CBW45653.1 putative cyclase [Streptomyces pristinaespiralis]